MLEYRDQSETVGLVKGPATTWTPPGRPYYVSDPRSGLFLEQFERGALVWNDAEFRREHDPGAFYAHTYDGTLRLSDTPSSLYLAAALDKTDAATRALVADIKARQLTGLSIGFVPDKDRWTKAPDGRTELRLVTRALLVEVSAVRKPANPGARIEEARHEYRSDNGVEYRSFPLVYRQVSGTTMERYPDAEPDDDSDETPPNLRTAAAGSPEHCGNCSAFDRATSTRMKYDRYPIPNAFYVCDSWTDTWSPLEGRRARTDAEVAALGKKGQALWVGDHYAWPIVDRVDLAAAIASFGRAASSAGATKVKSWIIRRARALGATSRLPKSWGVTRSILARNDTEELQWHLALASAGTGKRGVRLEPNDTDELALEFALRRSV